MKSKSDDKLRKGNIVPFIFIQCVLLYCYAACSRCRSVYIRTTTLCTYYRTSRDVVYVGFTWSNRESCAPLQQKNYPSSFEEAKALTTYPQQSKNIISKQK